MNVQQDLKAYVDGELSGQRLRLVETAIKEDAGVEREANQLRLLSTEIREAVHQPEPIGLEATLLRLQQSARSPRTSPMRRTQWFGALAAVSLLVVLGVPTFTQLKGGRSSDSASTTAPSTKHFPANGTVGGDVAGETDPATPPASAPIAQHQAMAKAVPAGTPAQGLIGGSSNSNDSKVVNGFVAGKMVPSTPESRDSAMGGRGSLGMGERPMIVRNADLTIRVKDVAATQARVTTMVDGLQGFVVSSNRTKSQGSDALATMTVRVPETRFDQALTRLRELGEVTGESASGDDVSAQVVDMGARLRVLKLQEQDYEAILGRTRKIGQVLEVKDRLAEVRQEIESLDAQQRELKGQARMSTITLTLQERVAFEDTKSEPTSWLGDTWTVAVNGLVAVGRVAVQIAIFGLVWSPLWLPATILAVVVYRRSRW